MFGLADELENVFKQQSVTGETIFHISANNENEEGIIAVIQKAKNIMPNDFNDVSNGDRL